MKASRYIYQYHTENSAYRAINKHTFAPDAQYIHSIIGNADWLNLAAHLLPYQGRGSYRMANYHLIHKSLAKWYTIDDWEEIAASDMLFVRKIRSKDGKELVHRIDVELLLNHQSQH